ncbi:MAG: acyltransferase [Frankiales bacterium]|nr:acyltransferase [Frankiales bacterium]
MRQLSWMDAAFVRLEGPAMPLHINPVMIYDPSTAPGGRVTFTGILGHLASRLDRAATFRQRLVGAPLGLSAPYWCDDPDFDLEYHVRHIALPAPGDWRQLCIQLARLHARPLDLTRPPWELTVIEGLDHVEGLPSGCFAVSLKVHHAALDGMEGVELLSAMHDLSPLAPDVAPDEPWQPRSQPSTMTMLRRSVLGAARSPMRVAQVAVEHLPTAVRRAVPTAGAIATFARTGGPVPKTRFNGTPTAHRVFQAGFWDFEDVRRIKRLVPGATVNDVALTHVGGSLRRYLTEHGEVPEGSLVAACPISVRTPDQVGDGGNMLSLMLQSLCSDIEDPVERLEAVHRGTSTAQAVREGVRVPALLEVAELLPGALLGIGSRALPLLAAAPAVANTTLTNVPGPTAPLYFCGAKAVRITGNGPILPGIGIIHLVGTYAGTYMTSVTAAREMMPDPDRYGACMEASFAELLAATR